MIVFLAERPMSQATAQDPSDMFRQAEKISEGMISGASFGKAINFNEHMAESLYSRGYIQYQQGRYEDAAKTFGFILFNDPINLRAMRGMASSLQMQGKFQEALLFLAYASVADDDNADISVQVIECLLHLGRKNDAMTLLQKVEVALKNDPHDEYVLNKVKGLRELLREGYAFEDLSNREG
jgi:tetratricopeptide (TPR) repeat protein